MNEEIVQSLMKRHNIAGYGFEHWPAVGKDGSLTFALSVMPILPFFLDLAKECGVPIENVHVDAQSVSTGYCETCAGHGLEVSVRVEPTRV